MDGGKVYDESVWGGLFDDAMAKMTEATALMRDGLEVVVAEVLDQRASGCPFNDAIKRFDLVMQQTPVDRLSEFVTGYTPTMPVEVLRYEGKPVAKLENWRIHVVEPYYAKLPPISLFVRWTDPRDPIRVVTVDGSQFGQAIGDANLLGTVIVLGERDCGHLDSEPRGGIRVTPREYQLAAMVLRRVGPNLFECQKDRRDDRTWHGRTIRVVPDVGRFEMGPRD